MRVVWENERLERQSSIDRIRAHTYMRKGTGIYTSGTRELLLWQKFSRILRTLIQTRYRSREGRRAASPSFREHPVFPPVRPLALTGTSPPSHGTYNRNSHEGKGSQMIPRISRIPSPYYHSAHVISVCVLSSRASGISTIPRYRRGAVLESEKYGLGRDARERIILSVIVIRFIHISSF